MWTWAERFLLAARLPPIADFTATVNAAASMPYGRPACRTPEGALEAWKGTCSTKHVLLALVCWERFPDRQMEVWHRTYRLTPEQAEILYGPRVAEKVPPDGVVDVHTYATALVDGERMPIDVTFPLETPWGGHSPMRLHCGPGRDHPGGPNPLATKALLVMEHCDPAVREPFIAALEEERRSPSVGP